VEKLDRLYVVIGSVERLRGVVERVKRLGGHGKG
jgi:hypothetical protein